MSLYGLLTTSASGMNAQSTLLGSVADNIANINTVGYKGASAQFASMVLDASGASSGSVLAASHIAIGTQGSINATTSATDLAIQGNGFFIVQDSANQPLLTRSGSFTENANGSLVNSAGYTLMGYPAGTTGAANGFNGLVPINLSTLGLKASPSTSGQLYLNVPSNATAVDPTVTPLPSANGDYTSATTAMAYTKKTSLVGYDNLGNQVTLDVYLTKLDPSKLSPAGTDPVWEVDVFDASHASSTGGFPYGVWNNSATPPTCVPDAKPLATAALTFNPQSGALKTGVAVHYVDPNTASSATPITISPTNGSPITFTVPNGQSMSLDMSQTTQLATSYTILQAKTNGNAPSQVSSVTIGTDGRLSTVYENGASVEQYTIPLATVVSPDNMAVVTGNAFLPNQTSGAAQIGKAGLGGVGTIKSSALEASTVDLSSELAQMISAQNNYQANSKVFQTGSQLLQVLINLQH